MRRKAARYPSATMGCLEILLIVSLVISLTPEERTLIHTSRELETRGITIGTLLKTVGLESAGVIRSSVSLNPSMKLTHTMSTLTAREIEHYYPAILFMLTS